MRALIHSFISSLIRKRIESQSAKWDSFIALESLFTQRWQSCPWWVEYLSSLHALNFSLFPDVSANSPYSKLQQSIKANGSSDTSSSYNDSCYGSSEMEVCQHLHHHHHHQHQQQSAGNKLAKPDASSTEATGKILLSSNENYIILCKDSSTSSDEADPSTPISSTPPSSSSSPTSNNNSLITSCQPNQRPGTTQQYRTQLKSTVDASNKKLEFFQNDEEYRKVIGSTKSFNCRNITPLNEYYL